MKLQEMQGALDAGEMVKKRHGDGLVAAGKIDGIYVSLQGLRILRMSCLKRFVHT